ncbi:MAG: PAS domain-containing sensor histidine kinase [Candidatus Dormibacteraeota bacterium]|nr:PAS domain-containing sensor histidine kinase [Candidatus Dormibacteraeota bacterium]
MDGPRVVFEQLGIEALRALVEGTADGILVVDSSGVIVHANRAAANLLGRPSSQLDGSPFGVPLVAGDMTEIEVPLKDGTIGNRELRVSRAALDGGEVFLVSLRDVTDRRQMEIARERARAEAEATARARSALLNMVAHEFRSPLSVISGYLSLMEEEELAPIPGPWRVPLHKAVEKVEELRRMVSEVLIAARLEAGRLVPDREPVDLRALVRDAVARAASRAALLDAQVKYHLPAEPVLASVDPGHVGIILDNLINNALSYSEDRPRIALTLQADGDRGFIRVRDHGVGIPAPLKDKVFERFHRLGQSTRDGVGGTGLGLSIARDLAQLNGGSLRLESSDPAVGSTFLIELPRRSSRLEGARS